MSYDPQPGDVPSYPQRPQDPQGRPVDGYDQPYGQSYDQPYDESYQQGYGQQGYGDPRDQQQGYDPMQQAGGPRSGPSLFPFPSWTTRTRGGSTVTVGGCCLPLPIGCLATTLAVGALATTRVVRRLQP